MIPNILVIQFVFCLILKFFGVGGGVNGRKIIMFSVLKTNTCIHYFDLTLTQKDVFMSFLSFNCFMNT